MSDPIIVRNASSPADTKDVSQVTTDASGNMVSTATYIQAVNLVATANVVTPSIITTPGSNADISIQPDGTGITSIAGGLWAGDGVFRLVPGNQSITSAGDTITGAQGFSYLTPDANYTLTSVPTITAGTNVGELKLIVLDTAGGTSRYLTLQDDTVLSGSLLRLGAPARTLQSQTNSLLLVWEGSYWAEVSYGDLGFCSFSVTAVTDTIPSTCSTVALIPNANYTLNVATAVADGSAKGQKLTIIGTQFNAFTVTLISNTYVAAGNLQLGSKTRDIISTAALHLVWNGNSWVEAGYSSSANNLFANRLFLWRDSGGSTGGYAMGFVNGDGALTADRTLTVVLNDADRTLTVAGSASISGTNTGDQFTSTTASRLIGRRSGSAGAAEEITLGTGLSMSSTTLNAVSTGPSGEVFMLMGG